MKLYLLGTGAAISDAHRTTTMLALEHADGGLIVVDCGGDVFQRLLACDLDPDGIEALILTHEHPDHISGFPLLIEKLWLYKRRRPLPIYGPKAALDIARTIFDAFDTSGWEGVPEREWNVVPMEPETELLQTDHWKVISSPVEHPVPTIGLRVESSNGATFAYSCDTAPSSNVVELARDVDLLVHEANGHLPGVHSSASEAGEIAARAGAARVLLVHLPPDLGDEELETARKWTTQVEIGRELGVYELGS